MHAKFHYAGPDMLFDAKPGDLFFPLGPDLVECLCTIRSAHGSTPTGEETTVSGECQDPHGVAHIVVLACRVEEGEPGFHHSGFVDFLPASTPVTFVEQAKSLELILRPDRLSDDDQLLLHSASASLTQLMRPAHAVRG